MQYISDELIEKYGTERANEMIKDYLELLVEKANKYDRIVELVDSREEVNILDLCEIIYDK